MMDVMQLNATGVTPVILSRPLFDAARVRVAATSCPQTLDEMQVNATGVLPVIFSSSVPSQPTQKPACKGLATCCRH